MTIYREGHVEEAAEQTIAVPAPQASLYAVLVLPLTFLVILLVLFITGVRNGLGIVAAVFGAVSALMLLLFWRLNANVMWSSITAKGSTIRVRHLSRMGGRKPVLEFERGELLGAVGTYVGPSAAMQALEVVAALTSHSSANQQPLPLLFLKLKERDVETVFTSSLTTRPELIARRLARFAKFGADGLCPTVEEIQAQAARFDAPRELEAAFWPYATRYVRMTREGLHVARWKGKYTLYPWASVVCAHVTDSIGAVSGTVQVELANGRSLAIASRGAHALDDIAALVAPRSHGLRDDVELSIVSRKTKAKKKKKKRKPDEAGVDTAPEAVASAPDEEDVDEPERGAADVRAASR